MIKFRQKINRPVRGEGIHIVAEIRDENIDSLLRLCCIITADMPDRDQAVVQKMRLYLRQKDIELEPGILRFLYVVTLRLITENKGQHKDRSDD